MKAQILLLDLPRPTSFSNTSANFSKISTLPIASSTTPSPNPSKQNSFPLEFKTVWIESRSASVPLNPVKNMARAKRS